jgi:hypothetical protein
MDDYPTRHVPEGEVSPMNHPFQLRIEGFAYHYNDYTTALEEFHALADDEPGTRLSLFQLGQYAPGKKEWHLISVANIRGGKRPVWTNLFAGYTLSRLFFLRNADRRELIRLGWPAPADAVSWKYADEMPPLEQQVAEALEPSAKPLKPVLTDEVEPETDTEELDLAAWAKDPGCRVDEATLRRRMAMGWDLSRAMVTPMLGTEAGEQEWIVVNGRRRYLPKY